MRGCALSPKDKRDQVKKVGDDLVKNYGKKKFYSVDEVKSANRRQHVGIDFGCWSHAMFNSHPDFDSYHKSIGENCDYISMKSEMMESVKNPSIESSWLDFDFDLSWLEFPDIDWSIFDFFDL